MPDSDLSGALCRACGQGGIALDTPARSDDQPGAEQLTPVMAAGPWSPLGTQATAQLPTFTFIRLPLAVRLRCSASCFQCVPGASRAAAPCLLALQWQLLGSGPCDSTGMVQLCITCTESKLPCS